MKNIKTFNEFGEVNERIFDTVKKRAKRMWRKDIERYNRNQAANGGRIVKAPWLEDEGGNRVMPNDYIEWAKNSDE